MLPFFQHSLDSLKEEMQNTWNAIRSTRWSVGLFFAIFCVFFVIVGNVMLLIALNFWVAAFPADSLVHNSSQIAIQVVAMIFLVLLFSTVGVVFTIMYGALPLWHILVDTNRVGGPFYRLFLLFCSGLTNSISCVLGVYAVAHTPEFIQAVLLCCIPFFAQAWTVIFIPIERKRNYLSMFFIASFVLFVAGVLLSSLSAFLHRSSTTERASWAWALLYLASSMIFGLWCVVQRLYLDAVVYKETAEIKEFHTAISAVKGRQTASEVYRREPDHDAVAMEREPMNHLFDEREDYVDDGSAVKKHGVTNAKVDSQYIEEDPRYSDVEEEEDMELTADAELLMKRKWASQTVDSNAAKVVLLLVGLLLQLLVSFLVFPVDAIPWFGTSDSAAHAWEGFRNSVDLIFASWANVRYGLLYSLGLAMSFIGCTYLNEHSPTLASVVLQLAGPVTSLVIIIIPQWNVSKSSNSVGQQVGGVILLLVAALLYHLWEQQSLRRLIVKAEEAQRRRQSLQQHEEQRHQESTNIPADHLVRA